MSGSVLAAVIGQDAMARLTPEDVRELARLIDDELLRDPIVKSNLTAVVRDAVGRLRERAVDVAVPADANDLEP